MTGRGLLVYSEEAAEHLHSESKRVYKQWNIPHVGAPKHADFLLRMVNGMNAAHLFSVALRSLKAFSAAQLDMTCTRKYTAR